MEEALRWPSLVKTARVLKNLGARYWLTALVIAFAAALLIGIPTRVLPNSFFTRMLPTRPLDYVFLAFSSTLIGLTWALSSAAGTRVTSHSTAGGGIVTVLAVGCPVCNKLVLGLLGTGGALTYFAPLQPILGVLSVTVLGIAFWKRLQALHAKEDESM